VEVSLVPPARREGAAQGAQGVVLVQQLADRAALPPGRQRVGERRRRGRGGLRRRVRRAGRQAAEEQERREEGGAVARHSSRGARPFDSSSRSSSFSRVAKKACVRAVHCSGVKRSGGATRLTRVVSPSARDSLIRKSVQKRTHSSVTSTLPRRGRLP